jgi:hypothetical protein
LPLLEIEHYLQVNARRKLANGYQLIKQEDVVSYLEKFKSETFENKFSKNALSQASYANLYLRVSEEIEDHSEFQAAVARSNKKVDRFLLALNVNEKLWNFRSDMRFSWLKDGTYAQVVKRDYWLRSIVDDGLKLTDLSKAAELTVTIDVVCSGEPQGSYPAVRTAFDALNLGLYNFNTSMRFLQEVIALEALCSTSDAEVTHRIATTCAVLVGTGREESTV